MNGTPAQSVVCRSESRDEPAGRAGFYYGGSEGEAGVLNADGPSFIFDGSSMDGMTTQGCVGAVNNHFYPLFGRLAGTTPPPLTTRYSSRGANDVQGKTKGKDADEPEGGRRLLGHRADGVLGGHLSNIQGQETVAAYVQAEILSPRCSPGGHSRGVELTRLLSVDAAVKGAPLLCGGGALFFSEGRNDGTNCTDAEVHSGILEDRDCSFLFSLRAGGPSLLPEQQGRRLLSVHGHIGLHPEESSREYPEVPRLQRPARSSMPVLPGMCAKTPPKWVPKGEATKNISGFCSAQQLSGFDMQQTPINRLAYLNTNTRPTRRASAQLTVDKAILGHPRAFASLKGQA